MATISQVSNFYADPVQKSQMSHFSASLPLGRLQKSLQDSLLLRQQSESAVQALSQQLQHSLSTARWIQEDAHLLRDDIQTLFSVEQA